MESLLRWSIEHSEPRGDAPPPVPRQELDPGIIDYILGKPDAQLMKEALEVAVDISKDDDTRIAAMDDLEMLVENIDNANDLKKLKMWEPLHALLNSPTTSDALKVQTLWVVGTAVQNNPAAQLAYLSLEPLPAILSCLSPASNSAKARSKAMYALSGLLKHNAIAVKQLNTEGWRALRNGLEDSDITVRRKTAFLLNALLIPGAEENANIPSSLHTPSSSNAPVHPNSHASMVSSPWTVSTSSATMEALQQEAVPEGSSLLDACISALVEPVPFGVDGECEKDTEFEENIVRLLYTFSVHCRGKYSAAQRHSLLDFLGRTQLDDHRFGLGTEEFDALKNAI